MNTEPTPIPALNDKRFEQNSLLNTALHLAKC